MKKVNLLLLSLDFISPTSGSDSGGISTDLTNKNFSGLKINAPLGIDSLKSESNLVSPPNSTILSRIWFNLSSTPFFLLYDQIVSMSFF